MADVPAVLRDARQRAGLSIDQLSARTRIKPHFLDALERGEYDRLPGAFFARAFLRTYAGEVGLPPDDVVREYDAAVAAAQPQPTVEPALSADATRPSWPPTAAGWMAAGGIALFVLALLFLPARDAAVPADDASDRSDPVGTAGQAPPEPVPASAEANPPGNDPLALELTATGELWLTAIADGERVVYRLLQPGEHVTLEAADALSLRVGNAGALEYTINGEPGVPLGAPGAVRTLHVTRENYRTFLR